ncbi:MAG TPA: ATP-binding protein [Candidatus Woesearchaeota archaeon]|nr:ATP-binding protein [Candidatus Woesearchaeota archaeon]
MKKEKPWFISLGFKENPFTIKPSMYFYELFGLNSQLDMIASQLKLGSVIFIESPYGTGKTAIMKNLIDKLKGEEKIIYKSLNSTDRSLELEELLKGRSGFLGWLFGLKAKSVVLMIDEASHITLKDIGNIQRFRETGNIKSVALSAASFDECIHKDKLKKLVGSNIIELNQMKKQDAIELVRSRVGELEIISNEIIEKIFEVSSNPRELLEKAGDAIRNAVEKDKQEVTEEDIPK